MILWRFDDTFKIKLRLFKLYDYTPIILDHCMSGLFFALKNSHRRHNRWEIGTVDALLCTRMPYDLLHPEVASHRECEWEVRKESEDLCIWSHVFDILNP